MLQTKIRKEVPRNEPAKWHPSLALVRQELWEYARQPTLMQDEDYKSLIMPCCICNAAIIVRCGILNEFISSTLSFSSSPRSSASSATISPADQQQPSPEVILKLLACIPFEMESCQNLTTPQVTQELIPHLEIVLEVIRRGLDATATSTVATQLPACMALKEWSNISHVSLSQLNTPTCGGPHAVLPTLISLLSSNNCPDERLLQVASQALTAAIMVVSDHLTPTREVAASTIWNAIPAVVVFIYGDT